MAKGIFESKAPESQKLPPTGQNVKSLILSHLGKKDSDTLTQKDIDDLISNGGFDDRINRQLRKAGNDFLTSGNDYYLQEDGNYDVYKNGIKQDTSGKKKGNTEGFSPADLIGLGKNMSHFIGFAKGLKSNATAPDPTTNLKTDTPLTPTTGPTGETPDASKNSSGVPVQKTSKSPRIETSSPSGSPMATNERFEKAIAEYKARRASVEAQKTKGTGTRSAASNGEDLTKPDIFGIPVEKGGIFERLGIATSPQTRKENNEKLKNSFVPIKKVIMDELTYGQRMRAQYKKDKDKKDLEQDQNSAVPSGPSSSPYDRTWRGGRGLLDMYSNIKRYGGKIGREGIKLSPPNNESDFSMGGSSKLPFNLFGNMDRGEFNRVSPQPNVTSTPSYTGDGKGNYKAEAPEAGVDSIGGRDLINDFGMAAKYIMPFIGNRAYTRELDKIKPISYKPVDLFTGVVRDPVTGPSGIRYRDPVSGDAQLERRFRLAEDSTNTENRLQLAYNNALSRINQRNSIIENMNRNTMFNAQQKNMADIYGNQVRAGLGQAKAEAIREPLLAAHHMLQTDLADRQYVKSGKQLSAAESIIKSGVATPAELIWANKVLGIPYPKRK